MKIDSSMLLNALSNAVKTASTVVKDPTALKILHIIGKRDYTMLNDNQGLITYAYMNKVLMLLLFQEPSVDTFKALRAKLLQQRKNFLANLRDMVQLFDKHRIDYVLFKTLRPVPETPVDIDVVVENRDEAYKAIECLKRRFHVEVWSTDQYSIGVRIVELKEFVDFYVKPHVADLVYMDSKPIIENAIHLYVNEFGINIVISVPKPEIEYCAILAHSIIKEGLVTLNDVLSLAAYESLSGWSNIAKWLSEESLGSSHNAFLKALDQRLPAKVGYTERVKSLISIMQKSYALRSLPHFTTNIHKHLKRFVELRKRTTYVRGLNR